MSTDIEHAHYLHCRECIAEKPTNVSPQDWARVNVYVRAGRIYIHCVRHDMAIGSFALANHIDMHCEQCAAESGGGHA